MKRKEPSLCLGPPKPSIEFCKKALRLELLVTGALSDDARQKEHAKRRRHGNENAADESDDADAPCGARRTADRRTGSYPQIEDA